MNDDSDNISPKYSEEWNKKKDNWYNNYIYSKNKFFIALIRNNLNKILIILFHSWIYLYVIWQKIKNQQIRNNKHNVKNTSNILIYERYKYNHLGRKSQLSL